MGRLKKFASLIIAAVVGAACFLMLILPPPLKVFDGAETYTCTWADGSITTETYADVLPMLDEIDSDGNLRLASGEFSGTVETSPAMKSAHSILRSGSLLALRALDTANLTKLERTALYHEHGSTVWYAGEPFQFDGTHVAPKKVEYAARVVLLQGKLSRNYLQTVGARELRLAADAEIAGSDFVGSKIDDVRAESPYFVQGGGIYRDTAGGRRLIAAIPTLTELTISDCAFADRGALIACSHLKKLTVPFVGSSLSGVETDGSHELIWLFQTSNGYTMPESLTSVTILGGQLAAFGFLGCGAVETIDACTVAPENIDRQAFLGADALKYLHTPQADVALAGEFTSHVAPCGCTIYERRGK